MVTGATYVFKFKKAGETENLTPAQVHLSVEGPDNGHDFTIKVADNTTLDQFRTLFGDSSNSITLKGTLTAANTISYSTDLSFNLTLTYDDSAQFGDPAVQPDENRWVVTDAYETYEGSTSLPDIIIPWTAFTSGARRWSAGTPTDVTFECRDQQGSDPARWPEDGKKDSDLFTVTSATSATSGTVTASFVTAPDYEVPTDDEGTNPSDNIYQLRITNDHDLHQLSTKPANIGCNGSAVDVKIQVKDVGTPSPVTPNGQFAADDTSQINLEWEAPTGFVGDSAIVLFQHTDIAPSAYEYRYRPTSPDDWVEVTNITGQQSNHHRPDSRDLPNPSQSHQLRRHLRLAHGLGLHQHFQSTFQTRKTGHAYRHGLVHNVPRSIVVRTQEHTANNRVHAPIQNNRYSLENPVRHSLSRHHNRTQGKRAIPSAGTRHEFRRR